MSFGIAGRNGAASTSRRLIHSSRFGHVRRQTPWTKSHLYDEELFPMQSAAEAETDREMGLSNVRGRLNRWRAGHPIGTATWARYRQICGGCGLPRSEAYGDPGGGRDPICAASHSLCHRSGRIGSDSARPPVASGVGYGLGSIADLRRDHHAVQSHIHRCMAVTPRYLPPWRPCWRQHW